MGRKARICVVDDEAALTEILCEGLQAHDFETYPSNSGDDALKVCQEQDIDLVLLDVNMPNMNGYDVCKALKSNPKTEDIAVIFVTGKGQPEDHEIGFNLGAVDYITKPFNLPMVMVRVEAALRMKPASRSADILDSDIMSNISETDALTGLRSQRFLMDRFQEEIDRSSRFNFPVSCVIIDVDTILPRDEGKGPVDVKDLLSEIAMELRGYTRSYDVLARFEGTLFVAILPHTDMSQAMEYGTKIMKDIDATTFSDPNFPTKAAVSVAVTTLQDGVIATADRAFGETMKTLLQAKSMPRPNRIKGQSLKAESKTA